MPATPEYATFLGDCDRLRGIGAEMVAAWVRCPEQAREPGVAIIRTEDVPAVEAYQAVCRQWWEACERLEAAGLELQRRWDKWIAEGRLTVRNIQREMAEADGAYHRAVDETRKAAERAGWKGPFVFGPEPSPN